MSGLEVRYRLGAEELIELGRSRAPLARSISGAGGPRGTFFGGRAGIARKHSLGKSGPPEIDWVASGAGVLSRYLDQGAEVLFGLAGIKSGNVERAGLSRKVSTLLQELPALGVLAEGLGSAAEAAVRLDLPMSRRTRPLLEELLPALEESLGQTFDSSRRQSLKRDAKQRLAESAPEHLRQAVIALLESNGLPGDGSSSLGAIENRPDASFPPLPVEGSMAALRAQSP